MNSRQHSQSLYLCLQVQHLLSLFPYSHLILSISSARLLTKFDNDLVISLVLSIKCNLQDIVFITSSPFYQFFFIYFSIRTEKVMYFQYLLLNKQIVFQIFLPAFYNKIIILVKSILKNYANFFRYTKLHMPCAASLYSPVW